MLLHQDLGYELKVNPDRVRWVDLANRLLHSEAYQFFYLTIGLLSLITLLLVRPSPSSLGSLSSSKGKRPLF